MMVEIYGKINCEFCVSSVEFCKENNIEYKYYHLDEDYTLMQLWELVKFKTFPQIWVDDEHIGGYTELKENYGS
jgi:glutaredoxin